MTKKLQKAINKTAYLVHSQPCQYVKSTLESGNLLSSYHFSGPCGRYTRDADRLGGGSTGVYTRAVGINHKKFLAKSYGVGSGSTSAVFVLKPESILKGDNWRCGGAIDGMGKVPGMDENMKKEISNSNLGVDIFNAWEKQTQKYRDINYFGPVDSSVVIENNEQIHWDKIPLKDNLVSIMVSSSHSKAEVKKQFGAKTDLDGSLFVMLDDKKIPVIRHGDNAKLLQLLKTL